MHVKSELGIGSEFVFKIPTLKCVIEKELSDTSKHSKDPNELILRMQVAFSDIYLGHE
jgi:hypothetical protein